MSSETILRTQKLLVRKENAKFKECSRDVEIAICKVPWEWQSMTPTLRKKKILAASVGDGGRRWAGEKSAGSRNHKMAGAGRNWEKFANITFFFFCNRNETKRRRPQRVRGGGGEVKGMGGCGRRKVQIIEIIALPPRFPKCFDAHFSRSAVKGVFLSMLPFHFYIYWCILRKDGAKNDPSSSETDATFHTYIAYGRNAYWICAI